MLNDKQYEQLLKPINPSRIAKRSQAGRNLSYLEAWDVKAHLIRIFGFGGWSADVVDAALAYEEQNDKGQWQVGYKVTLRLTIHGIDTTVDDQHMIVSRDATYTEAAVGSASLPQRGEAHDMAVKTAESDALKRAAINLGTQFGLSLYDNGSTKDVVGMTLDAEREMVTVTNSETSGDDMNADGTVDTSDGAVTWVMDMKIAIDESSVEKLLSIKKAMNEAKVNDNLYQGVTLGKWMDKAMAQVGKGE